MDIAALTFKDRDEFKRIGIAEKAISLLKADIDISPMVIDGSWGTGKTEFCHKLIDLMRPEGAHHLIYIDAFNADHANEPLMTVLAEVIKILPNEEAKKSFKKKALPALRYGLKTIMKAGVSHLLRQDVADVVDEFDKEIQKTADKAIDATVESVLRDHVKADENLKTLQTALAEIVADKPIVFFIDELDRCRPNFAVDMLEIIKHTFDVDGVSFVLITNTQQLKASINHCYGQTVDAQRYLDKFVKFTIALPETIDTNTHNESNAAFQHYKNLVSSNQTLDSLELSSCASARIIETIIDVNRLSLREVETIVRHIEIYVTLAQPNNLQKNTIYGIKILTAFAIALYSIRHEVASSILQKRLDAKDIGNFLGRSELSSLSDSASSRPDIEELISYMLGSTANFNNKLFLPKERPEKWKAAVNLFFNNNLWRDDECTSTCTDTIQTLMIC